MAASSIVNPTEEIATFFASGPSVPEIAAFHLSDATVTRVRELLARNAAETLSPEENAELDQLVLLDRIMMLIRSRLPTQDTQHASDHMSA